MSSKPEDRPKMIGLIVAIVGVLAYVLITLVPKFTGAQAAPPAEPPPPPPALASASVSSPGGAATPGAQSATTAPLPDGEDDQVPPPPAHDSFTPPASDTSHPPPTPQQPAVIKPAVPVAAPNAAKAQAAGNTVAAPVAPVLPSVELKGVILGDPAIAVLSINNEVVQRQAGDLLAGGLKLVKIEETGIVLQEGKKQIQIAVGHSLVAAPPQAMSAATAPPLQPVKQ